MNPLASPRHVGAKLIDVHSSRLFFELDNQIAVAFSPVSAR
jgi:hypothetical protein